MNDLNGLDVAKFIPNAYAPALLHAKKVFILTVT